MRFWENKFYILKMEHGICGKMIFRSKFSELL